MQILLCGATGFIGQRLGRRLIDAGHTVVAVARDASRLDWPRFASRVVAGDLTADLTPQPWLPRLAGIDAVVNAAGILREHGSQTFEALHVQGPKALFDACARCGVRRVVQVSALGADAHARSHYHLSKRAADDYLLSLPLDATVVQPSLVYGPGGASASLFKCWASLPVIPVPGDGRQLIQPVHIDEVVEAVLRLIESDTRAPPRIALVGPQPLPLRRYLEQLRAGLGLRSTAVVKMPLVMVEVAVTLGSRWPGALFDQETLDMLQRGNAAPADGVHGLLGRAPRPVEDFVDPAQADMERSQARLAWTLPLLRASLAMVWIVTGVLSFGVYPVEESYALLARLGITGPWASLALYGAASLDLALGVGTLLLRRRILLWCLQIALMLSYMLLITWALPEFWLHPFGPILKNLPMLAAVGVLLALEKR
jgi:nucleoside-diphosphate-sugar epimerase